MATKLMLSIGSDKEAGQSKTIMVEETFDDVLNKVIPLTPPTSAEGHQLAYTYNKADGSGRVLVHPNLIATAEENADEDE